MVVGLKAACEEAGVVGDSGDDEGFITEEDIVRCVCLAAWHAAFGMECTDLDVPSVAEAQRSTTVFAKFEYSLKRLLWLGG